MHITWWVSILWVFLVLLIKDEWNIFSQTFMTFDVGLTVGNLTSIFVEIMGISNDGWHFEKVE